MDGRCGCCTDESVALTETFSMVGVQIWRDNSVTQDSSNEAPSANSITLVATGQTCMNYKRIDRGTVHTLEECAAKVQDPSTECEHSLGIFDWASSSQKCLCCT